MEEICFVKNKVDNISVVKLLGIKRKGVSKCICHFDNLTV